MELLQQTRSSHWYHSLTGAPVHEVKCKSKEGMRPTTVKDARLLNLVPSVTNVLSLLSKPGLDSWKIEQAILSALTLPRIEGEDDQDFAKRVVIDMDEHSKKAMETGSRIHWYSEQWIKDNADVGFIEDAVKYEPFVTPMYRFLYENGFKGESEKTVASAELGYAGTVDFVGSAFGNHLCLVDFKTQGTKAGKKANFYAEWSYQLSAYARLLGFNLTLVPLISMVISTTEPGRIEYKEWNSKEVIIGWEIFEAALKIFKLQKGL